MAAVRKGKGKGYGGPQSPIQQNKGATKGTPKGLWGPGKGGKGFQAWSGKGAGQYSQPMAKGYGKAGLHEVSEQEAFGDVMDQNAQTWNIRGIHAITRGPNIARSRPHEGLLPTPIELHNKYEALMGDAEQDTDQEIDCAPTMQSPRHKKMPRVRRWRALAQNDDEGMLGQVAHANDQSQLSEPKGLRTSGLRRSAAPKKPSLR